MISKKVENYEKIVIGYDTGIKETSGEPTLKTGDLIFLSGTNDLSDFIINILTLSKLKLNHSALIINKKNEPHLFECITSNEDIEDYNTKKIKNGVMLVNLKERINTIKHKIYIKYLYKIENEKIVRDYDEDKLSKLAYNFYSTEVSKDFETSYLEMCCSILKLSSNKESRDEYFCSELIAAALQEMKLLPRPSSKGYASKFYNPESLSNLTFVGYNKKDDDYDYFYSNPIEITKSELLDKINKIIIKK